MSLFTDQDKEAIDAGLGRWVHTPVWRAVVFRNALQAFLVDIDGMREKREQAKAFCIDTTEIVAFAASNNYTRNSFSFYSLVSPEGGKPCEESSVNEKCAEIDRMVTRHLLFDRAEGCLLLEPYAEELAIISHAISKKFRIEDQRLLEQMADDGLLAISKAQFQGIEDWIGQSRSSQIPAEFFKFRDTFLPGLRTNLIANLYTLRKAKNLLHLFTKSGNYSLLGPASLGDRSFFARLNRHTNRKLNWQDFKTYYEKDSIQATIEEIQSTYERFSKEIRKSYQSDQEQSASNSRDGIAIATVHVLNSYLKKNDLPPLVTLVSRSMTMHAFAGLLPNGKINFQLRHPLFIPEIYQFDTASLQTIAHIFQSVDNAVKPYMDNISSRIRTEEGTSRTAGEAGGFSENGVKSLNKTIGLQSQELIRALADTIAVQQVLERDEPKKLVQKLLLHAEKSVEKEKKGTAPINESDADRERKAELIENLFRMISDRLRNHRDPFSIEAIRAIAQKNRSLISFERRRIVEDQKYLELRYINVRPTEPVYPIGFIMIRPVGGKLPRAFHLYSDESKSNLLGKDWATRGDYSEHRSIEVSKDFLLALADSALDSNDDPVAQQQKVESKAVIESLEATLLACIVFSDQGHYSAAATIASTILNQVTTQLQIFETGSGKYATEDFSDQIEDPVILLALKELFLIRHYCERAIAINQLHYKEASLPLPRGETAKNLARAQRDLDLAVLMNEHAEKVALKLLDKKYSATGIRWFQESRFPIIHFSAWLDQLVAIISSGRNSIEDSTRISESASMQELWRRHEIWTLSGLAKECEVQIDALEKLKLGHENTGFHRYLSYSQVRALQNNLLLFIVLLAYDFAPELQSFWRIDIKPKKDRILVFRNWRKWYNNFQDIEGQFDFELVPTKFVALIYDTISSISRIRDSNVGENRNSDYRKLLSDLGKSLEKDINKFERGARREFSFLENLTGQLITKINNLQNERL